MKIDARLPLVALSIALTILSIMGYQTITTFETPISDVYIRVGGALLTGFAVGNIIVTLLLLVEYTRAPKWISYTYTPKTPYQVMMLLTVFWIVIGYFFTTSYTGVYETYAKMGGIALMGGCGGALIYLVVYFRSKKFTVEAYVGKPVQSFPVRTISESRRLSRFARSLSLSFAPDILRAGLPQSPYAFASRYIFYSLTAGSVLLPISVALAIYIHPLLVYILLLGVPIIFVPQFMLKNSVGDRKRITEDELPFFTIYASIMQSVGLSLYNSFEALIGRRIFKAMEREALLVKRSAQFFSKSQVEALEEVGRSHPNSRFRTMLLGYTSQWRSGADMAFYLETKAKDILVDMKLRWHRYATTASDLGEMMVSVFFVLPILVLTAAFIYPVQTESLMAGMVTIALPLLTVLVYLMIANMQPKIFDVITGRFSVSVTAGVGVFAAMFFISPIWLAAAVAAVVSTVVYGWSVMSQRREITSVEKALPDFLRDVTEYKKMGYDINKGMERIAEENRYNPIFDGYVRSAARQMNMGLALSEVQLRLRSWLGRMTFFLLGAIVETGGGTPAVLESLTNFITEVNQTKKETRSTMRLYTLLAYATPVGLAFVVALMVTLLSSYSSAVAGAAGIGLLGGIGNVPESLIQTSNIMIIAASASIGFLASKTVDFTGKNTLRIALCTALAVISIIFMTSILPRLGKGILGIAG